MERVRTCLRTRHYSRRTERAYAGWVRQFIVFHGKRHLKDLGEGEVAAFLSSLATTGRVAASTQNQALSALLFLYRDVLGMEVGWFAGVVRARRPERLPVVLTREEVHALLRELRGTVGLMASLMYGAGLRVLECSELRVKDVDFTARELRIRDGKGRKDRVTMLPARVVAPLAEHLAAVKHLHVRDVEGGGGWVALPDALMRKYPTSGREWPWQWVFPATRSYLGSCHRSAPPSPSA